MKPSILQNHTIFTTSTLGDAERYRFGFNGKENITEVSGWQDYGERFYNTNLARFFSPDPIIVYQQKYPELSTYQFASNTPIMAVDLDGLEAEIRIWNMDNATYTTIQVPKENQIGEGILNFYYRTNNKGVYKLYKVEYNETLSEWWNNSGASKAWNVLVSDNWGIHFWGSSDGSNSPGRKTTADKIIGEFDFAAFMEIVSLHTQANKTKSQNSIAKEPLESSVKATTTAIKENNKYTPQEQPQKSKETLLNEDTTYYTNHCCPVKIIQNSINHCYY